MYMMSAAAPRLPALVVSQYSERAAFHRAATVAADRISQARTPNGDWLLRHPAAPPRPLDSSPLPRCQGNQHRVVIQWAGCYWEHHVGKSYAAA